MNEDLPINPEKRIPMENVSKYVKQTKIKNDAIMEEIERKMPEMYHVNKHLRPQDNPEYILYKQNLV
jgi:hypothetical protein